LAAQAGFFTLDRLNREVPLEDLFSGLMKLTLPKSEAPALLAMLADIGVSAASVFPGYSGAVRAIFERSLWGPERTNHRMRSRWALRH
jgi:hypothetical protein